MKVHPIVFLAIVFCAYALPLYCWWRERKKRAAEVVKSIGDIGVAELEAEIETQRDMQPCGHHFIHAVIVVNHPEDGPEVSCEICHEQMPKVRAKALTEAAEWFGTKHEQLGWASTNQIIADLRRMAKEKT